MAEEAVQIAEHERQERERAERVDAAIQELLTRRSELVNRFLYLAERRVALRDEWGMERWSELPEMIFECISRLGQLEGFTSALNAPRDYKNGTIEGWDVIEETDPGMWLARWSQLGWIIDINTGAYQLILPDKRMLLIEVNRLGEYEVARHVTGIKTLIGTAPNLKSALNLADKHVPAEAMIVLKSDAAWRNLPMSDSQLSALARLYPEILRTFPSHQAFCEMARKQYTKGQASQMISQRMGQRPRNRRRS